MNDKATPMKLKRTNGLIWILPAFLFLVIIIYYSMFFTFNLSTMDWDGLSPNQTPVGLANFAKLFRDKVFWKCLQNTVVYFIITFVVQNSLGFIFAAILHTDVKLATLHKCLIFIPTILAPATMAPVFRLLYSPQGILQSFFNWAHIPITVDWLSRPNTALYVLMSVAIWEFTGMSFILYFAAMSQIDMEMLEAARIDGAGNLRTLWSMVLPNCRGTTVSMAMLGVMEHALCVVTGAANGIGRAVAERLIEEGADLIVADYDESTARQVYGDCPQVLDILKIDATKIEDLECLAEAARKTGRRVKAVLPIVGNGPQAMIPDITPEDFRLTMDLNVFSAFFTVQKLLPCMGEGSTIVLISSIAGFQGGKNALVYNAAKAAVRSMARSFAGELAERGIRANAISPGPTETKGFSDFVNDDDEARRGIIANIPLGHIGKPSEIAAVALFLASDESSFVTGAEIIADGGFTNR